MAFDFAAGRPAFDVRVAGAVFTFVDFVEGDFFVDVGALFAGFDFVAVAAFFVVEADFFATAFLVAGCFDAGFFAAAFFARAALGLGGGGGGAG